MNDSILKRFVATLATNAVGSGVSFVAAMLIARTLGARGFGDYSFLFASFTAINTWLDIGTSNAFYTFLSKGGVGRLHIRLYAAWLGARLLLVGVIVALLPAGWLSEAWLGQSRPLVLAAWCGVFASVVLGGYLTQLAESARRTVFVQTGLAALSLAHLVLVVCLRLSGTMSLAAVFGLLVVEYVALAAWFARRYDALWHGAAVPEEDLTVLGRRYAAYCGPLAGYAAISFLADYADRWMLQRFGGSAQQGYFALSSQCAAVSLLATVSMTNIFWKEISSAAAIADRPRLRELYGRAALPLFFIAAAGGAFLSPHAKTLVAITAGPQFAGAWLPLALLLTFPAFQSLGQLNGAFFLATEDTRTHVAIGSIGMLAGLPLSYLVLAPRGATVPGLALGATGLSARLWLVQAATVTVQSAIVSRRLGGGRGPARYWVTLAGLIALSVICAAFGAETVNFFGLPFPGVSAIGVSAVPFGAALAAVFWFKPEIIGVDSAHIEWFLAGLRRSWGRGALSRNLR